MILLGIVFGMLSGVQLVQKKLYVGVYNSYIKIKVAADNNEYDTQAKQQQD